MNFKLLKKATNKLRTSFHVVNSAGDIVGSINVAPSEEADLLRHWAGSCIQPQASAAASKDPMIAALLRNRTPMSRAAVLRGCS
jgi:hypothetical protein